MIIRSDPQNLIVTSIYFPCLHRRSTQPFFFFWPSRRVDRAVRRNHHGGPRTARLLKPCSASPERGRCGPWIGRASLRGRRQNHIPTPWARDRQLGPYCRCSPSHTDRGRYRDCVRSGRGGSPTPPGRVVIAHRVGRRDGHQEGRVSSGHGCLAVRLWLPVCTRFSVRLLL